MLIWIRGALVGCMMLFSSIGLVATTLQLPDRFGFEDLAVETSQTIVRYGVRHGKAQLLREQIVHLFPGISVALSVEGAVLLLKVPSHLKSSVLESLEVLDQPTRKHRVSLDIVECAASDLERISGGLSVLKEGVGSTVQLPDSWVVFQGEFNGLWQALRQDNRARVLATPRLVVDDHQPASIQVGDRLPYVTRVFHNDQSQEQVNFLDSGIELSLTVSGVTGNRVMVDLEAAISAVKLWKQIGTGDYPIVSRRVVDTQVSMGVGESFVIAGLLSEDERRQVSSVPILGDLPLIGGLFQTHIVESQQSDVILVVTVHDGETERRSKEGEKAGYKPIKLSNMGG